MAGEVYQSTKRFNERPMLDVLLFTGEVYRGIVFEQTPTSKGIMFLSLVGTGEIKELPNRLIQDVSKINSKMTRALLHDIGRPMYFWNSKTKEDEYIIDESYPF